MTTTYTGCPKRKLQTVFEGDFSRPDFWAISGYFGYLGPFGPFWAILATTTLVTLDQKAVLLT